MTRDFRRIAGAVLGALLIGFGMQAAQAGTIATDDAISAQQAVQDRARVKALVARPEVARALAKLGIAPEKAGARVNAMTDQEVVALAGKLDALPAGGALSNTDFLLVIVVLLLVVIIL
ncbi:MAG TPA: PA2779 family protein [Burkholderiales bacterium]|nr:PA2779 family protein [Burkholderiales bacterium]